MKAELPTLKKNKCKRKEENIMENQWRYKIKHEIKCFLFKKH